MSDPDVAGARRRILAEYGDTVRAVVDAADAVATTWERETTGDRTAVAGPLERLLRERGLADRLVALLAEAVDATGRDVAADPVPAPPYLAITGRGPVLRGPVADGRLVVTLAVFAVERDGGARYRRVGSDPGAVLEVEFRQG